MLLKATALAEEVASKYGWEKCQGGFYHPYLGLKIQRKPLRLTLIVGEGRPVCLRFSSTFEGDDVACLITTIALMPAFAEHINAFDPTFVERWKYWKEVCDGQKSNLVDLPWSGRS